MTAPPPKGEAPQGKQAMRPLLSFGDGMIGEHYGLNDGVRELQQLLNIALEKLDIDFRLEVDGMFGAGTEKVTRLFQMRADLVPHWGV
jgi:peptidoglycan hydrolase-like protein with peptidoglycan-binding domain